MYIVNIFFLKFRPYRPFGNRCVCFECTMCILNVVKCINHLRIHLFEKQLLVCSMFREPSILQLAWDLSKSAHSTQTFCTRKLYSLCIQNQCKNGKYEGESHIYTKLITAMEWDHFFKTF